MTRADIYGRTLKHFLAPVADLLYEDESISEVMINGPDTVYIERAGRLELSGRKFASAEALTAAVRNLAEYVRRRLDADNHSRAVPVEQPGDDVGGLARP